MIAITIFKMMNMYLRIPLREFREETRAWTGQGEVGLWPVSGFTALDNPAFRVPRVTEQVLGNLKWNCRKVLEHFINETNLPISRMFFLQEREKNFETHQTIFLINR